MLLKNSKLWKMIFNQNIYLCCCAIFLFLCLQTLPTYAWNAVGHRLVMEYALDALSPEVKRSLNFYNHALDAIYKSTSLINASTWLDEIRYQHVNWFDTLHYYDASFSEDGSPLSPINTPNAVTAIIMASQTLHESRMRPFDKGIALRILIHVTADIHQPLHAATHVSKQFPEGDKGGNLVILPPNPIANNLHSYWDQGGGYLMNTPRPTHALIKMKVKKLITEYPCVVAKMQLDPMVWESESFLIAKKIAYRSHGLDVSEQHQAVVAEISKKQIALAGCRLAALLTKSVH